MRLTTRKFHFLKVETYCSGLRHCFTRPITPVRGLLILSTRIGLPSRVCCNFVSRARIAGSLAGGYHEVVAKRSLMSHGAQFLKHVVPEVIRPIRSLWHEVIGFLFLCFAGLGVFHGIRAVRAFDGEPDDLFRLVVTALFVVIMGGFGISSFLRARKISRS